MLFCICGLYAVADALKSVPTVYKLIKPTLIKTHTTRLTDDYLLTGDDVEAGAEGFDVVVGGVAFEADALEVIDVVRSDGLGGDDVVNGRGFFRH